MVGGECSSEEWSVESGKGVCEGSGEGFTRIAAIFAMESYLKMSSLHTPVNSISTPRV